MDCNGRVLDPLSLDSHNTCVCVGSNKHAGSRRYFENCKFVTIILGNPHRFGRVTPSAIDAGGKLFPGLARFGNMEPQSELSESLRLIFVST